MIKEIIKIIKTLVENDDLDLNEGTPLIGDSSPLDSMNIVNLCLQLEEVAEEQGFQFDWSGETMSKSKSMFRSIRDLPSEFEKQQTS